MDKLYEGWFSEISSTFPGQSMSLKVKSVLCDMKTKYQDLIIFESESHGRVMILDGIIQLTERDEFMYQEMISFLPLNCHPAPQNVLIIGGGDGGVAREVARLASVRTVTQCEIDSDVVEMSKKHLPFMACGYENPKVSVSIGDGFEYLKEHKNEFDVIITDSTDPQGPGEVLFESSFYKLIYEALKEDGIMCSQGENVWLDMDVIKKVIKSCKCLFPVVSYAKGTVPTYTNGEIGYLLCSKNEKTVFEQPLHEKLDFQKDLRYYSPAIHRAAFVMPASVQKQLDSL